MTDITSLIAESCAFIFGVTALLSGKDNKLKGLFGVSAGCMSLHFFIEGATTAGCMTAIGSVRFFLSAYPKMQRLGIPFMILYLISGALSYSRPIDLLPVMSSLTATYGLFFLQNMGLRLTFFAASSFWLIHNITVGSYIGAALEASFLIANIHMMLKMRRAERAAG